MSKCKAVLDSEKITEIKVKTKTKEEPQKDRSGRKSPDDVGQIPAATLQHPE